MERVDIHHFAFIRDEDTDCFIAAFGEDEENVVMIQLAFEFDKQDTELGWDTYCLVLPSQATFYGGVQKCALEGEKLTLWLSDEAKAELEIDDLELHLRPWMASDPQLIRALTTVFNVPRDRPELVLNPSSSALQA